MDNKRRRTKPRTAEKEYREILLKNSLLENSRSKKSSKVATAVEDLDSKLVFLEQSFSCIKQLLQQEVSHLSKDGNNANQLRELLKKKIIPIAQPGQIWYGEEYNRNKSSTQQSRRKQNKDKYGGVHCFQKFHGVYESFPQWYKQFEKLILPCANIEGQGRLECLQEHLNGQALRIVQAISPNIGDYDEAVSVLRDNFSSPDGLIRAHIFNLLNLPHVSIESDFNGIKDLYYEFEVRIQSLKYLGFDIERSGPLFSLLLESKIPQSISRDMREVAAQQSIPGNLSLKQILCYLSYEVERLGQVRNRQGGRGDHAQMTSRNHVYTKTFDVPSDFHTRSKNYLNEPFRDGNYLTSKKYATEQLTPPPTYSERKSQNYGTNQNDPTTYSDRNYMSNDKNYVTSLQQPDFDNKNFTNINNYLPNTNFDDSFGKTCTEYCGKKYVSQQPQGTRNFMTQQTPGTRNFMTQQTPGTRNFMTQQTPGTRNYMTQQTPGTRNYMTQQTPGTRNFMTQQTTGTRNYMTPQTPGTRNYMTQQTPETRNYMTQQPQGTRKYMTQQTPGTMKYTTQQTPGTRNYMNTQPNYASKKYNSQPDDSLTELRFSSSPTKNYITESKNYSKSKKYLDPSSVTKSRRNGSSKSYNRNGSKMSRDSQKYNRQKDYEESSQKYNRQKEYEEFMQQCFGNDECGNGDCKMPSRRGWDGEIDMDDHLKNDLHFSITQLDFDNMDNDDNISRNQFIEI